MAEAAAAAPAAPAVALVEPDAFALAAMRLALEREGFAVAAASGGLRRGLRALAGARADLLVIDADLPEGNAAAAVAAFLAADPARRALVHARAPLEPVIAQCVAAGAGGFVTGEPAGLPVARHLRLLLSGGSPVSPEAAPAVLRALQRKAARPRAASTAPAPPLSPREGQVLAMLARGLAAPEIASVLAVSPHTAASHIRRLYRKLQAHSRGEALYRARILGLVD
ncbi:MAG: response regulator transcription factor [Duodenibacillus sp.]|nr:response regulator transcription factor [Duodenibacillus sp.]